MKIKSWAWRAKASAENMAAALGGGENGGAGRK